MTTYCPSCAKFKVALELEPLVIGKLPEHIGDWCPGCGTLIDFAGGVHVPAKMMEQITMLEIIAEHNLKQYPQEQVEM